MHFGRRERLRFVLLVGLLAIVGTAATVYMLANQRFPNPFADTYTIQTRLSAADGVVAGLGQPVDVAGVKVGTIVKTRNDADGNAVLTLEINRDELPQVGRDAQVSLEPITPLKDMQLNLDPGKPGGPRLGRGQVIGLDQSSTPVPLDTLLTSLDTDTRTFLAAMLGSVGDGTRDRGEDLRQALLALGPTTAQLRQITAALEGRRVELARLVTNLGAVTDAASQDRDLARVVAAGERTLRAVATEDASLRAALRRMPATFDQARDTLGTTAEFADVLRPALDRLRPSTKRLGPTLRDLEPFTDDATVALRTQIRPLVRELTPTLDRLAPTTRRLADALPGLYDTAQSLRYFLNVLAYNPEGRDEGGLFWLSWALHNLNSVFSLGEAHGGAGRATVFLSCQQVTSTLDLGRVVKLLTGASTVCPETP